MQTEPDFTKQHASRPAMVTRRDLLKAGAVGVTTMLAGSVLAQSPGGQAGASTMAATGPTSRPLAKPGELVPVGFMEPVPGWPKDLTVEKWAAMKADVQKRFLEILGPFPKEKPELNLVRKEEVDCGTYTRIKVEYSSEVDDRIPAWLLVPKNLKGPVPGILALHSSTQGAGKNVVVGLASGRSSSQPSSRPTSRPGGNSRAYAPELVAEGYVVLAPDVCADGERAYPGAEPRDTRPFYAKHPEWSYLGKIIWDNMRSVDVLSSIPEVDPKRIGTIGHSLGGHSSILCGAFDERPKAMISNDGVTVWDKKSENGWHWSRIDDGTVNCYVKRLLPYFEEGRIDEIPVRWYEIFALVAPRAMLILCEGADKPFEFRNHKMNHGGAAQIYRMLGHADRLAMIQHTGPHNFAPESKVEAFKWFRRWL